MRYFICFLFVVLFTCCKSSKKSTTSIREGKIKQKYYNAMNLGDKDKTQKLEKKFHKATKKKH